MRNLTVTFCFAVASASSYPPRQPTVLDLPDSASSGMSTDDFEVLVPLISYTFALAPVHGLSLTAQSGKCGCMVEC